MTDWTTASGEDASPKSNLADTCITATPNIVVGNRNNLEVSQDGTVIANTSAEHTMGQEVAAEDDVMATLQSHSGGGVYGRQPTAKDTVVVGGYRTHLVNAVHLGAVVLNGDGTYSNAPQKPELKDPTEAAPIRLSQTRKSKASPTCSPKHGSSCSHTMDTPTCPCLGFGIRNGCGSSSSSNDRTRRRGCGRIPSSKN